MSARSAWMRRLVTFPALLIAWVMVIAAAGLWFPLAVLVDLLRPRAPVALRCGVFLVLYLTLEWVGLLVAALLTLGRWVGRIDHEGWLDGHARLQIWWAGTLLESLIRLFRVRLEVEGEDALSPGPYLLFIRHSSIADTLLAALLVGRRHGIRLRYVLKRELLWDPCLDLVGNRLPNVFVRRGSDDSAREVARVGGLARGLGSRDAVLIYPEGTRFTRAKRARILERLEREGAAELHEYAESLRRSLPPRLGGPLALLEEAPEADVIFCVHVGFEAVATLVDIWAGDLLGATVRVHFRRVARSTIPGERSGREDWLQREWQRQDRWLSDHRAA